MASYWADNDTRLVLSGIGIPRYSGRGIKQSLRPIAADLERTIAGTLVDLTYPPFKKYASVITCTDLNSPAFDGVFPGTLVTVDCIKELGYAVGGSPQRPVVSGSAREENGFVFYRPRLEMMVVNFQDEFDEWLAYIAWQMELQEV